MSKKHKKFFHRKEKQGKKHSHSSEHSQSVTVEGTIEITRSGAAYLIAKNKEEFPDDIFIAPKNTANALNGDLVKIRAFSKRNGKRTEGEVIDVLERKKTEFVGTLQMSKSFGFLIADDPRVHVDIFIPEDKLGDAKDGQKALAKITGWEKWKNNPTGEIIEVLGNPGENETEIHSILAEFGLPYSFPEHLEREADRIPVEITEKEISQRRDFRSITTFTIDPVDAKDFDDALSIRWLENGHYEIGVHIADVTHYVKPGSQIEEEAQKRATSVYLVDRVVPMLPEILSNNVCSLRPNEEKLCFSAVFEMNHQARVMHKWFGKTVINSDRRFTYEEVQKIIDAGDGLTPNPSPKERGEKSFVKEILELNSLAKILRKERIKKGAIAFNKVEVKFNLDEKANPVGVFFKTQQDSHKLIEEFMLLANRSVAEQVGKHLAKGKPSVFVYRVHDLPNEEKIQVFSQFIRKFGYKLSTANKKNISQELNTVLDAVKGKQEENMIETLAVRTMMKAIYTTQNIGHYGLAFDYYTHFTSPIRRYPDMMVHRLLEKHIGGNATVLPHEGELEGACKHSSKMEKLAEEAERASIKYKQVQYLLDRVGETFEGIISGVTEWGLFVELVENKCEGMIRLRDIHSDFFVFDEENYRAVGKRSGKVFQLGDKVTIIVKKADIVKKQLDFEMVDE